MKKNIPNSPAEINAKATPTTRRKRRVSSDLPIKSRSIPSKQNLVKASRVPVAKSRRAKVKVPHLRIYRPDREIEIEPLIDLSEVANRMQVDQDAVENMVQKGYFKVVEKRDDVSLFHWSEVVAWILREVVSKDWERRPLRAAASH